MSVNLRQQQSCIQFTLLTDNLVNSLFSVCFATGYIHSGKLKDFQKRVNMNSAFSQDKTLLKVELLPPLLDTVAMPQSRLRHHPTSSGIRIVLFDSKEDIRNVSQTYNRAALCEKLIRMRSDATLTALSSSMQNSYLQSRRARFQRSSTNTTMCGMSRL